MSHRVNAVTELFCHIVHVCTEYMCDMLSNTCGYIVSKCRFFFFFLFSVKFSMDLRTINVFLKIHTHTNKMTVYEADVGDHLLDPEVCISTHS